MSSAVRQSLKLGALLPGFKPRTLGVPPTSWARHSSSMKNWDPAQFKPRKAVILTKVSRYEYEKIQNESLSERQLEEMLTKESNFNIYVLYILWLPLMEDMYDHASNPS